MNQIWQQSMYVHNEVKISKRIKPHEMYTYFLNIMPHVPSYDHTKVGIDLLCLHSVKCFNQILKASFCILSFLLLLMHMSCMCLSMAM